MSFLVWTKTMTAAPLDLTVEQEGVGGIAGLVPKVALRNAATLDSYFDWSDSTFKTSGWGSKYASLTHVERGHYQRTLNAAGIAAITAGMVLAAEFRVNESGIIGDSLDLVFVQLDATTAAAIAAAVDAALTTAHGAGSWQSDGAAPTPGEIADAVWDEQLAAHQLAGSTGEALGGAQGDVVRATGIPPT